MRYYVKNIAKRAIRGALVGVGSTAALRRATQGCDSGNAFSKNLKTIVESTKTISDIVTCRKKKFDELRYRNEIALKKERNKGKRRAVIVGVVGLGAGCAAGYALSKAYDITRSDMVFTSGQDGQLFEDSARNKILDIPEKPITAKKFVSSGNNSIMSVDGTTIVVRPQH